MLVDAFQFLASEFGAKPLGLISTYAASSCEEIATSISDSTPGLYWIMLDDSPTLVQCDF